MSRSLPSHEEIHLRALAAAARNDLTAALALFDSMLVQNPVDPQAWLGRGVVLSRLRRQDEALACFDQLLRMQPGLAEGYYNRAISLRALRRLDEALADMDQVLALRPGLVEAMVNRALTLTDLGRPLEAVAVLDQVLKLRPAYPKALLNRGAALSRLGRHESALVDYDRALAIQPDYVEAWVSKGISLTQLGRTDLARASFDRALILRPGDLEARFARAYVELLHGEFVAGWTDYEARWGTAGMQTQVVQHTAPRWSGVEELAGLTIHIHAEQGLGDTLQFWRFLPAVRRLGAEVIVSVQAPLLRLLSNQGLPLRHVAQGIEIGSVDFHCPLMSLPLALGETSPPSLARPYLSPDPALAAAWRMRIGSRDRLRVGLAWSGNPANVSDARRSVPLAALLPLCAINADFYCVQKDVRPADREHLATLPRLRNFHADLGDFADTAALLDALDLVITVDTSAAHLAGALGKPVWLLLPAVPDWRWMLHREDSPWYPSMKLFRQPTPGDWASVVLRVTDALRALAAGAHDPGARP